MTEKLPRVESVSVTGSMTLRVHWRGVRTTDLVDLAGWVATGGDILAPLLDQAVFARAHVENYGTAVAWDDGDLAIDAFHLKQIADEQKPFEPKDAQRWQYRMKLSNSEVAILIDVSRSTWAAYKAGNTPIPKSIAMVCRFILRDPLPLQAHLRPRVTGRPKGKANASH
jgi:hypothetical protein